MHTPPLLPTPTPPQADSAAITQDNLRIFGGAGGAALALAGALTTWVTYYNDMGYHARRLLSASCPEDDPCEVTAQMTAGGSLLLISFIFAAFELILNINVRAGKLTTPLFRSLVVVCAATALLFSFIGTILGGNAFQQVQKDQALDWSTGFATAVAAVAIQTVVLLLNFLPLKAAAAKQAPAVATAV